jgi:site-specific DNA recombinase
MGQLRLPDVHLPDRLVARLQALGEREGTAAVMYVRISQDREGAGLGVERQLDDLCDLFERLGFSLAGVYADNDLSAYSGKPRPEYQHMLTDLAAGHAKAVTAWHTDRLHRSPVELEKYIAVCDPRGVVTYTVKAGHLDLATPSGRMIARQLGAVARFESEHKADRIRAARRQAASAGRWQGGARPFGFEADGETIRPDEAAEILAASEAIVAGASLRSVVRAINERGFRTTFGRQEWKTISFKDVLLRPRNAGLAVYRGEVVGRAVWDPIVPEDTWRALVSVLTDDGRRTTSSNRVRWLGSGLYVCGVCELPDLRVSTAGGREQKPAYRCRARTRGDVKDGPHVVRAAGPLDAFVEHLVVERLSRPDAVELLRAPEAAVDTAELSAEAVTLRQRLDDLDDDLDDGRITRARWQRRNDRMRERLGEIDREIEVATRIDPLAGIVGAEDVAALWFGAKPDRSDGLDLGRRRAVLGALVGVTVLRTVRGRRIGGASFDPDGVRVDWKR